MDKLAQQQREFLQAMRFPSGQASRAQTIYSDLVFNNFDSYLSGFFPVLKSLTSTDQWHSLVRDFIQHHPCQTPYFLAIAEEFLQYALNGQSAFSQLPAYAPELAHYEWVELALDIADLPSPSNNPRLPAEEWLHTRMQLSPLAWCLEYQYPLHSVGPSNPNPAPEKSTYLVYRNPDDAVKFMHITPASAALLQRFKTPSTPAHILQEQQASAALTTPAGQWLQEAWRLCVLQPTQTA
jgi:uncharacterized protein